MKTIPPFHRFSDSQLIDVMPRLILSECSATAVVVAGLMEFDTRRLFLPLGYPSLFQYCLKALHLTEDATFNRLEAARAARKYPRILELLQTGELSLTAVRLLAPHLTADNQSSLLEAALHKTKREVELLIANANPQPPVASVIRKLPELKAVEVPAAGSPGSVDTADEGPQPPPSIVPAPARPWAPPPSRRPVIAPLSDAHYKLQITISAAARGRLQQIQDLMRHRIPNGDAAAIVEHALELLHAELLKQKAAQVAKPRTGKPATEAKGRCIPASVKREVWRRDHGKCAFLAQDGRKCGSTDGVEFHNVQPYAVGGKATATNIEMRCRAHNGFEWERHLDQETAALSGR